MACSRVHAPGIWAGRPGGASDEQETAMAENAWTQAEEAMLVAGFRDGSTPDDLADALRKSYERAELDESASAADPLDPRRARRVLHLSRL